MNLANEIRHQMAEEAVREIMSDPETASRFNREASLVIMVAYDVDSLRWFIRTQEQFREMMPGISIPAEHLGPGKLVIAVSDQVGTTLKFLPDVENILVAAPMPTKPNIP
jgi:hypothetical protein